MIRFIITVLCFALLPVPLFAADALPGSSLFFTPQQAHEAEKLAAKNAPAGQGDINLGAIMYYRPGDWVLWLQGQKWSPQTVNGNLRVLDVNANQVTLSWHDDEDAEEHQITLHANESYQIATGRIISAP